MINNSLRGVVESCHTLPEHFGTAYADCHGIEGVLREELLDLSAQDPEEIGLLRTTQATGAIGTCRYNLKAGQQEGFARVVEVLAAHDAWSRIAASTENARENWTASWLARGE